MSAPFLGTGWAFPVHLDEHGQIAAVSDDELVRQSIWSILATAPGERVMRPTFGCGLTDLVFAPNTAVTHGLVASHIRDALVEFEPRIDLGDVAVAADPADPTRLLIEVDYTVRSTNSRFNLVFPFYLG
jgi:phage baseplate assembly protein W